MLNNSIFIGYALLVQVPYINPINNIDSLIKPIPTFPSPAVSLPLQS